MDRRKMLQESVKSFGQSLPRMLEILAGAGLLHSSLGERQEKEMKVDLGELPPPLPLKSSKKPIRRIP
jgi:hypothetical protein